MKEEQQNMEGAIGIAVSIAIAILFIIGAVIWGLIKMTFEQVNPNLLAISIGILSVFGVLTIAYFIKRIFGGGVDEVSITRAQRLEQRERENQPRKENMNRFVKLGILLVVATAISIGLEVADMNLPFDRPSIAFLPFTMVVMLFIWHLLNKPKSVNNGDGAIMQTLVDAIQGFRDKVTSFEQQLIELQASQASATLGLLDDNAEPMSLETLRRLILPAVAQELEPVLLRIKRDVDDLHTQLEELGTAHQKNWTMTTGLGQELQVLRQQIQATRPIDFSGRVLQVENLITETRETLTGMEQRLAQGIANNAATLTEQQEGLVLTQTQIGHFRSTLATIDATLADLRQNQQRLEAAHQRSTAKVDGIVSTIDQARAQRAARQRLSPTPTISPTPSPTEDSGETPAPAPRRGGLLDMIYPSQG